MDYFRRVRMGTVGTAQILPPLPGKQAGPNRGAGFSFAHDPLINVRFEVLPGFSGHLECPQWTDPGPPDRGQSNIGFLARRVKRLLPALAVVAPVCEAKGGC